MHFARMLGIAVYLRPYISEQDEKTGLVQNDICVSQIETKIDSEAAYCYSDEDREMIDTAIQKSSDSFSGVNQAVERIRLDYLLHYPIHNISGDEQHNAAEQLSKAIDIVLPRVVPTSVNETIMSFDSFCQSDDGYENLFELDPLFVFGEWMKHVILC